MRAKRSIALFLSALTAVGSAATSPRARAETPGANGFPPANNGAVAPQAPAAPAIVVHDVALDQAGSLRGQVVTPEGAPMAATKVTLDLMDHTIAEATTDPQGYFQVNGMRGGIYRLTAAGKAVPLRVWTHDAAPPSATLAALVVAETTTLRGQINYMSEQVLQVQEAAGALLIPGAIVGGAVVLKSKQDGPAS